RTTVTMRGLYCWVMEELFESPLIYYLEDQTTTLFNSVNPHVLSVLMRIVITTRNVGAGYFQTLLFQRHDVCHRAISEDVPVIFQDRFDVCFKTPRTQRNTASIGDKLTITPPITLKNERTVLKERHISV